MPAPQPPANMPREFSITADRVSARLLLVMLAILMMSSLTQVVVHLTGHDVVYGLIPLFYVDAEANVPTLFSVLLLLFCAALLQLSWREEQERGGAYALQWLVLSLGFCLMAVDEFTSIHERLTGPIRAVVGGAGGGLLYYGWVLVGGGLVLALSVYFLGFVRALPAEDRRAFLTAGALYLGGALVMESIGGRIAMQFGQVSVAHSVSATLEESFEMLGLIWFIRALITRLGGTVGVATVRFAGAGPSGRP